jgi:hypothetical protein
MTVERRLFNHLAMKALPIMAFSWRFGTALDRGAWVDDLVAFARQVCADTGWRLSPDRQRAVVMRAAKQYWPQGLQLGGRMRGGWPRDPAQHYAIAGLARA